MGTVEVCVIGGYGINADCELADAFSHLGARVTRVHLNDLIANPGQLDEMQILAFPGGFSFGDHLGAGLVFAARFRGTLGPAIDAFLARGGLAIGICNGFQILVKMGILPNLSGDETPEVSLIHNESGRFVDEWVEIDFDPESPSVWTRGLEPMEVPIRHGEGRFVTKDRNVLDEIERRHLGAVRYRGTNPNGSTASIAGICDPTGRVIGLMPHPEAFLHPENHPRWRRERITHAAGLDLLEAGIREVNGG